MAHFLSSLWKELRHSTIPTNTKLIVCGIALVFFVITLATSTVVFNYLRTFLVTPITDLQLWHVFIMMVIGSLMFGGKRR